MKFVKYYILCMFYLKSNNVLHKINSSFISGKSTEL